MLSNASGDLNPLDSTGSISCLASGKRSSRRSSLALSAASAFSRSSIADADSPTVAPSLATRDAFFPAWSPCSSLTSGDELFSVMAEKVGVPALEACCLACHRLWLLKFDGSLNFLGHSLHLNGRSPVWTRTCIFKLLELKKVLLQCSHLYFFSPVCFRRCDFSDVYLVKLALHSSHVYAFPERSDLSHESSPNPVTSVGSPKK